MLEIKGAGVEAQHTPHDPEVMGSVAAITLDKSLDELYLFAFFRDFFHLPLIGIHLASTRANTYTRK